jgi:hypothetical protein
MRKKDRISILRLDILQQSTEEQRVTEGQKIEVKQVRERERKRERERERERE